MLSRRQPDAAAIDWQRRTKVLQRWVDVDQIYGAGAAVGLRGVRSMGQELLWGRCGSDLWCWSCCGADGG